ncbi:hypothetical protein UY3_01410 [Chelonia mydas]|uniref:Uncharacterized protein n=1 Tax=Chelonia mydas TaxID=8469 RepID=M7BU48_CHEMY|nr:hypothetical protein UY3_01410 [Chelonia mydas]
MARPDFRHLQGIRSGALWAAPAEHPFPFSRQDVLTTVESCFGETSTDDMDDVDVDDMIHHHPTWGSLQAFVLRPSLGTYRKSGECMVWPQCGSAFQIFIANGYLLLPRMLNPILYEVRTHQIRDRPPLLFIQKGT